jgi:glycosyltransferase involved in cell wall biosynthesis
MTLAEARKDFPSLKDLVSVHYHGPAKPLARYFRIFWQYSSPEFGEALRDLRSRNDFDLVYVFGSHLAQYGPLFADVPSIIDSVDSHSLYMERKISMVKGWKNRLSLWQDRRFSQAFEKKHFPGYSACLTVAPKDTEQIQRNCPGLPTWTVPISVNTEYFRVRRDRESTSTVVFSGKMDYSENVFAAVYLAQEVFPKIRREIPEARLVLVGANPKPDILALKDLPGVTVTGFVEDIREVYRKADVAVFPLLSGCGIKCKALEAMAMETPVVMTRLASEGLVNLTPREAEIAEGSEEIAESAVALLRDPERARAMGMAARRYIIGNFEEKKVCGRVIEIIEETVRKQGKKI